jgi:tRNA G10  N-methylase Trm11
VKPPYYQREHVVLYHGDARDFLPDISRGKAIVTAPPYGEHYIETLEAFEIFEAEEVITLWHNRNLPSLQMTLVAIHIWDRQGVSPLYQRFLHFRKAGGTVVDKLWSYPPNVVEHHHQQPIAVMLKAVQETDPNLPILDPYVGFGTTLIAASAIGRTAIGIERDEQRCEIAAKRLEHEN